MATALEIQTKVSKLIVNMDRLDAIVNGPDSGPESLVQTDDHLVKTVARLLADIEALYGGLPGRVDTVESSITLINDALDAVENDINTVNQDLLDAVSALEDADAQAQASVTAVRNDLGRVSQDMNARIAGTLGQVEALRSRAWSEFAVIERRHFTLSARLESDYLSAADIAETFLAIADLDGALASYDLNLNATFAALSSDLDTVSGAVSAIEADYLVSADLTSALAAFGLSLSSTFNIPTRFDGVEGDITALDATVATIDANYVTQSDIDSAFAAFGLNLASTYDIGTRFGDIEGDITALDGEVDTISANASLALSTLATLERSVAQLGQRLSAQLAGALAQATTEITVSATRYGSAISRIDAFEVSFGSALAAIEADYLVSADLDSALAAFGLSLSSTFNIPTRFDGVEGDITALDATVATIDANYVTQSDIDSAFAAFGLNLASTYDIGTRFGDIEGDITALDGEVDTISANASLALSTLATLERSVAQLGQRLSAQLAGALAQATTEITVSATRYGAAISRIDAFEVSFGSALAAIEADYLVSADLDSALAAFGLSLSSTFNIPTRFDGVEDELDPLVPGSLAATVSTIDANYVTQSDIDTAFSSFGLNVAAAYNVSNRFGDIEDDIDGVAGVSSGLNALVSVLASALVDTSDPDNPVALALFEVALAASGGAPALLRLTSGAGDPAVFAAEKLVVGTYGVGGALDDYAEVMEFESGYARLITEMRLKLGSALAAYYNEGVAGEIKVLEIGHGANGPFIVFRNRNTGEEVVRIDNTVGAVIGGGALRAKQITANGSANVTIQSTTFVDLFSTALPDNWNGLGQGVYLRNGTLAFQPNPTATVDAPGDVNQLTGKWQIVCRKSGEVDMVVASSRMSILGGNPGMTFQGTGQTATQADHTFGSTDPVLRGLRFVAPHSGPGVSLVVQGALETTAENPNQPAGGKIYFKGDGSAMTVDLI